MKKYICALILIIFNGCSDWLEFSPYDTPVKSKNLNSKNAKIISRNESRSDTVRFILISDSHYSYDDLTDAVGSINKANNIQFVICCGDVTDAGLAQEYDWYWDIIKKCRYPVFTAIGNHDCRSNGYYIFVQYFGFPDFTFTFDNYKFILFDDIVWEKGNIPPDFEWLRDQLSDSSLFNVLITHIPPWTDQLQGAYDSTFRQIVSPENTILCLHGHGHNFEEKTYNGIHTVVSGSINYRRYNIITLAHGNAFIERINF